MKMTEIDNLMVCESCGISGIWVNALTDGALLCYPCEEKKAELAKLIPLGDKDNGSWWSFWIISLSAVYLAVQVVIALMRYIQR